MAASVVGSRRGKKVATTVGVVAIASIGVMGLLHTSLGKPLLSKMGGCPVASPKETEVMRSQAWAVSKPAVDTPPATAFALGFELDHTKAKDVLAWGAEHKLACTDSRESTVIVCTNVPPGAFTANEGTDVPLTEVSFGFRASDGALFTVTGWRQDVTPAVAVSAMNGMAKALATALGPPHDAAGEATTAFLSAPARTTVINYHFVGYSASVSAVVLPSGVWVREVYTSTKVTGS